MNELVVLRRAVKAYIFDILMIEHYRKRSKLLNGVAERHCLSVRAKSKRKKLVTLRKM